MKYVCNYSIIRFLPYPETGEFVNIGVVLIANNGDFQFKIELAKHKRVTDFFHTLDRNIYIRARQELSSELRRVQEMMANCDDTSEKISIFNHLTHERETMIRFSRPIPYMQWCGESDAVVTSKPSLVGVTANTALNPANPWALALHGSALPGDSVLLFASNPASSSLPILPTINGVALTDSATGGDANGPAVRTCWKTNLTAAEITAGLAGTSGAAEVYALVFRKAGSAPTFVLPTYYKTPSTTTTVVSWPAVAFAQDCILAGFFQCQSTDDLPMRTGLTEIADRPPSSASAVGISGLLRYGVDSTGATTTTKTGTAGRAVTSQVAVY